MVSPFEFYNTNFMSNYYEFFCTNSRNILMFIFYSKIDLQKLCSTLAKVSLCEMAEVEDRSSSSGTATADTYSNHQSVQSLTISSSTKFNSTMISHTSHLNELQKENRAPSLPSLSNSTSLS